MIARAASCSASCSASWASALSVIAVGMSIWLILLLALSGGDNSSKVIARGRRIAFSVLLLIAEAGCTWLAIEFASRHQTGQTWLTGGLGLAISALVFLIWLGNGVEFDAELMVVSMPIVLTEISLGALAVSFALGHHPAAAWPLAGLAVAEAAAWMVLPEDVASDPPVLAAIVVIYAVRLARACHHAADQARG